MHLSLFHDDVLASDSICFFDVIKGSSEKISSGNFYGLWEVTVRLCHPLRVLGKIGSPFMD